MAETESYGTEKKASLFPLLGSLSLSRIVSDEHVRKRNEIRDINGDWNEERDRQTDTEVAQRTKKMGEKRRSLGEGGSGKIEIENYRKIIIIIIIKKESTELSFSLSCFCQNVKKN